jgi:hypothetical protein
MKDADMFQEVDAGTQSPDPTSTDTEITAILDGILQDTLTQVQATTESFHAALFGGSSTFDLKGFVSSQSSGQSGDTTTDPISSM